MNSTFENNILQSIESRRLIVRVYHYLKAEYEYTVSNKRCPCDVSHLSNVLRRTADAVGITLAGAVAVIEHQNDLLGYNFSFQNPKQPSRKRPRDSHIDIDDDTPVNKKVNIQIDVKKEKLETELQNPLKKLVNYVNFEEDVKEEEDIREKVVTEEGYVKEEVIFEEDDEEEEELEQVTYDSITIKDEYIL